MLVRVESHGPFLDYHDHLGGHDDYNVKKSDKEEAMGKRMVILGSGRKRRGRCSAGSEKGFDVFVSDMGKIKPHYVDMLDRYGIAWKTAAIRKNWS